MRISIYIAKQLALAILVVTIAITCVIWLSQSLRFIDLITNRGLSVLSFTYLTLLLVPSWLPTILPIAMFVATLFVYNRMAGDREIMVLEASGLSPLRLARPMLLVALTVALICYLMTLYLVPVSYRAFKDLQYEIRNSSVSVLLREGVFNTLNEDITVYIGAREATGEAAGELVGIIVHDKRDPGEEITIIAERGALVRGAGGSKVVMEDGNRQSRNTETGAVSLLYFDQYVLNIAQDQATQTRVWRDHKEEFLPNLLNPTEAITAPRNFNEYIAEGHARLSFPLLNFTLPLIGLAMLLRLELSRRGQSWRTLMAACLALLVEALSLSSKLLTAKEPWLIPLTYVLIIGPGALAILMLARSHIRTPRTAEPPDSGSNTDPDTGEGSPA